MDYETVSIEKPCCPPTTCWIETCLNPGWNSGEIKEILLTLCGNFIVGNTLVSAESFMKGSTTKYFQMELQNYLGEVVDTQTVYAKDFEFFCNKAACYYVVDQELSQKITPGTYYLFVSVLNTIPKVNEEIPEKTILNLMLTDPEGIQITVN